jgi:putative polyketide hydroxylase
VDAEESTPVLVVGGGLAGLSAALFLAWRGVPVVVVEKHAGSSPHPRAMGFTTRTLELFRAVGIGARIPEVPFGHVRPRRIAVESLAGKWSTEVAWSPSGLATSQSKDPPRPARGDSPCTGAAIAQDKLEAILRDEAIALGADVRLNTELTSFAQDAAGVVASLRTHDGRAYALRADHMIAADGHSSPIREALGIGRTGHGFMQVVRSVLFRAALDEYLEAGISQFELDQPGLKGMLTTYRDGRWLLMFSDDEERDAATLKAKVVQAIGRSDLDVELITTGRWVLSALIADRFSSTSRRVFLAGDAAHTLPPTRGGYGANTGIEDAFNLAWKLAAVVAGVSTRDLLETYDAERRPIAWLRHDQIFARRDYAAWATDAEKKIAIIDDDAMELGQLYRSKAVVEAGHELPPALRPEQWAGQPGTRAPHLWVSARGEQISTLDLLQRDWMLVTEDGRWCEAAARAGAQRGLTLASLLIGGDAGNGGLSLFPPLVGAPTLTLDTPLEQIAAEPEGRAALDAHLPAVTRHEACATFESLSLRQLQPLSRGLITDEDLLKTGAALAVVPCHPTPTDPEAFRRAFRRAFGIGPAGASLVRPDGYVAWRSSDLPTDPGPAIAAALAHVAFPALRPR